jgi:hypothetical protein
VAATAAAAFFGTGLLIGGTGLALRQGVLVFLGNGRDQRDRVRAGLHLAGQYACEVVPRSARGWPPAWPSWASASGAFLAGYLNVFLMDAVGVAATVGVLGAVYLVVMMLGSRLLQPPPAAGSRRLDAAGGEFRDDHDDERHAGSGDPHAAVLSALGMLCINVTAGIGILAQASPMMQDMFGRTPLEAAAVVSLISLFNAGGRFLWASGSDYIGRATRISSSSWSRSGCSC